MAEQNYTEVTATLFFNVLDRHAKRLLTCVSAGGHSVSYVDKKTECVVGYIVIRYDDVSKYYMDTEYDFNPKNKPEETVSVWD